MFPALPRYEVLEVPDRKKSRKASVLVVEAGNDISTRRGDCVVDDLDTVDYGIRYAPVKPPTSAGLGLLIVLTIQ